MMSIPPSTSCANVDHFSLGSGMGLIATAAAERRAAGEQEQQQQQHNKQPKGWQKKAESRLSDLESQVQLLGQENQLLHLQIQQQHLNFRAMKQHQLRLLGIIQVNCVCES